MTAGDDVLNRDLVDKVYVSTKRCTDAVRTETPYDPCTNATINFQREARVGVSAQIDDIVSVAVTKRPAIRAVQLIGDMSSGSRRLVGSLGDSERID